MKGWEIVCAWPMGNGRSPYAYGRSDAGTKASRLTFAMALYTAGESVERPVKIEMFLGPRQ